MEAAVFYALALIGAAPVGADLIRNVGSARSSCSDAAASAAIVSIPLRLQGGKRPRFRIRCPRHVDHRSGKELDFMMGRVRFTAADPHRA
jgi:hypothetical protein